MKEITAEKLEEYLHITEAALQEIADSNKELSEKAKEVVDMAQRYLSDAKHYRDKGDFVTAFASVNYAHGWLDAGARLGLFKVNDKTFFAID